MQQKQSYTLQHLFSACFLVYEKPTIQTLSKFWCNKHVMIYFGYWGTRYPKSVTVFFVFNSRHYYKYSVLFWETKKFELFYTKIELKNRLRFFDIFGKKDPLLPKKFPVLYFFSTKYELLFRFPEDVVQAQRTQDPAWVLSRKKNKDL